jgi:hypothetical protein
MHLLRSIVGLLGIAVLLLSTGDCVNLLFADDEAHECCMRGDCPGTKQDEIDSCCNIPASDSAKYAQAGVKTSLSQPVITAIDFPVDTFHVDYTFQTLSRSVAEPVHAPPGVEHGFSLPLLI